MSNFSKILILVLFSICNYTLNAQQVKILFDASKAETANNADWVIDADAHNLGWNPGAVLSGGSESNAQKIPLPSQTNISAATIETYWSGALSSWGIDCVKRGYQVETLPYNGFITYNTSSNSQDLSNYKIFVVCEPNIRFTSNEKIAILNFVQGGGSLYMISDHTQSDRNNDGWDSPAIWNELLSGTTVGITFNLTNISETSTSVSTVSTDSLIHGPFGNVSKIQWFNGCDITVNIVVNPSVKIAVYRNGISNDNTKAMCVYARYGKGKIAAIGDSSPFDDGTGDSGDQLYNGYIVDAAGNHQLLIMNTTIWLAQQDSVTAPPISIPKAPLNLTVQNSTSKSISLNWIDSSNNEVGFKIYRSNVSGGAFTLLDSTLANTNTYLNSNLPSNTYCYKVVSFNSAGSSSTSNEACSVIEGIAGSAQHPNIMVYPNPAEKTIIIETPNSIREVYLINAVGEKIQIRNIFGGYCNTYDISSFAAGMYRVEILTQGYENSSFIKLCIH